MVVSLLEYLSLVTLLSCVFVTNAEHASVYISYTIPPTAGDVIPIHSTESRDEFPTGDIMISHISFNGVSLDGQYLPYRMMAGSQSMVTEQMRSEAVADVMFLHTILHQGSMDETDESWKHFAKDDTTTWAHGAIMYGTTPKNTSFEPFGIRLHEKSPLFSCLHATNSRDTEVELVAEWEIIFERLNPLKRDPRSLLTGWYCMPPPAITRAAEGKQALRVLFGFNLRLAKDVRLRGWMMHAHPWVDELSMSTEDGTSLLSLSNDDPSHLIPKSDSTVTWLNTKQDGVLFKKGEPILIDIIAENPSEATKGPFAFSLYFTAEDGSDAMMHKEDLLLPYEGRSPDKVNKQMMSKVNEWNQQIFKSLAAHQELI